MAPPKKNHPPGHKTASREEILTFPVASNVKAQLLLIKEARQKQLGSLPIKLTNTDIFRTLLVEELERLQIPLTRDGAR